MIDGELPPLKRFFCFVFEVSTCALYSSGDFVAADPTRHKQYLTTEYGCNGTFTTLKWRVFCARFFSVVIAAAAAAT